MMEDVSLRQCRQILKKNNLHPLKKLGQGAFSLVFSVEKIQLKSADNEVYSVKCINKKQFAKKPYLVKYIEQEINSLRGLDHRNIVRLVRTFEDEGWIFILMEYCDRGNIYSYQTTRDNAIFDFHEAAHIIASLLQGLKHIHNKNLIHRDIKAENILLVTDPDKKETYGYITKICDLGFCREDDENVNTFCGTTSYMAPEIFRKSIYCNKVDVWAVGVLMYRMLFGDFPFKSINMEYEINSKCLKGFNLKKMKVKPNPSLSKDLQETLAEIFNRIFTVDPEDRIGIDELRKYKFFQGDQKVTIASLSTESQSGDQQATFQKEKVSFLEEVLVSVKKLKFLTQWEEVCFDYYIKKMALTILQPFAKDSEESKKKYKELQASIDSLGGFIDLNMKNSSIQKLKDYYTPHAPKFVDFKQPYRLVVGHVFSKAHKSINENIPLRSQVKMQLFCCHLINRIFEKEYRNEIFTFYFEWLKSQKKAKRFAINSFKEWIRAENPEKLVQTVEIMNEKFYKKK